MGLSVPTHSLEGWLSVNSSDLEAFSPFLDAPLVISFIEMAREDGFATRIEWDFWDFSLYADELSDDPPDLVVKSIKNRVTSAQMGRLVVEPCPLKVFLVDGNRPKLEELRSQSVFFASTGTGVYVRDVGWLTMPHRPVIRDVQDLQLKMAPRWSQDVNGVWQKTCSKCGETKGLRDFYPSASSTARDPYRNVCISCFTAYH